MNQTKQTSKPFALLTWLLVLAVTCVMALAATSCDSGDKDEPKKEENLDPSQILPNCAWNYREEFKEDLEDQNIESASFYFLQNGKALQRIVYKTGKPTEIIRCFSYKTGFTDEKDITVSGYGEFNSLYVDLFLASGTKFCRLKNANREPFTWMFSPNIPNLKLTTDYYLHFDKEELNNEDVNCIETYSSMKVGDIKEIGGSGSGSSTDDDTPTIDSRIIGTWEYNEDGDIYRLTFTKSGYVEERTNADNYEDFTYNKFSFDGKNLTLPDDTPFSNNWGTNFTVTFSGSYMTLSNSLTTSSGVTIRFRKKS